jgi:hypothetical protein
MEVGDRDAKTEEPQLGDDQRFDRVISDDQTTICFSIISKQKNKKSLSQTWICV